MLNNNSDVVQTINPANLTLAWHAVSYGSLAAPVDLPTGGSQTVYYLSNSLYNISTGWAKGNVSLYETPGAPNTQANAAWLQAMDSIHGPTDGRYHQHQLICATQLPFTWNGIVLNTGGDSCAVYATTSVITGCDSSIVLDLDILPPAAIVTIDTSGCGSVFFEEQNYTYSRLLKDTLLNSLGCDSVYRNIQIIVHSHHPELKIIDIFGCHAALFEGVTYTESTVLTQYWLSAQGCDSLNRKVNIVVEKFELGLTAEPEEPYKGELLHLRAHSNEDYTVIAWQPAVLFKEQEAGEQYLIAGAPTTVTAYGQSIHGCTDTGTVSFTVLPPDYGVFIPNAFSPNGDGTNDVFAPRFYMKRAYYLNQFQIFDRWGKSVYHSTGTALSWNGNDVNGAAVNTGVYHYRIEVEFADGEKRSFKGDLTLIR